MATNNSSQQRLLIIAAVVVAVLLFTNGFLLWNKYGQDTELEEKTTKLEEADKLKIELEKQYHEALSELEEMRGSNQELNAIIDQQKEELKAQRDKVDKLIREGKELGRARAELGNLRGQVQQYVAQIQQLRSDNEALRSEADKLAQKTEALTQNLDSANVRYQQLEGEKTALNSQNQQLTEDKLRLSDKVNLASVVRVDNLVATPLKERNSGKTKDVKKAKDVDLLQICFRTTENRIAKAGTEQFFVRVLNPQSVAMTIDELGGGKFKTKESGEELSYTFIKEYEYNNDAADLCTNWDPNVGAFGPGKYKVEVYNKGYLVGSGEFTLK